MPDTARWGNYWLNHEGHRMGDTHTEQTWAIWYPQPRKHRGQLIVQQCLWEHAASSWLLYWIGWWSPERYVVPPPAGPVNVTLFGKRVFVVDMVLDEIILIRVDSKCQDKGS